MTPFSALVSNWVLTAFWPIVGQRGVQLYAPVLFMSAGLAVGLLVMAPSLVKEGRWRLILSRRLAPPLSLLGLFSGAASLIYVWAVGLTTPTNAAVMAQVEVLYSAALSAWLLRERITSAQAAASLLVMAGTALIMAHDLDTPRWKGDLVILATPWMFQVSHVFAKRLPPGLDPLVIAGGRIVYGLLLLLPFASWAALTGARWTWGREGLGLLAVQGTFLSCLNLVLWYRAIRGMDLAKATAFLLSYPAGTLLLSWALGREAVSPLQVAGMAVTLCGATWLSWLMSTAGAAANAEGTA